MGKSLPQDMAGTEPTCPTPFAGQPRHLSELMETAELQRIDARILQPHPLEVPERFAADHVLDLKQSITAVGLRVPPLVWRRADRGNIILAGHRRVTAWRLLFSEGLRDVEMPVLVSTDLTESQAIYIMASETYQVEAWSAVQDALVVGGLWTALTQELGGVPSRRELASFIPPRKSASGTVTKKDSLGRTAVQEALTIYAALQDPRWADAVRRADSVGKRALYTILRAEDEEVRRDALEAAAQGNKAQAVQLVRNATPRPAPPVVSRKEVDGGFEVTIRVSVDRSPEELRTALDETRRVQKDLRRRIA